MRNNMTLLLCLIVSLSACSERKQAVAEESETEEPLLFEDGKHCARVEYYNPNTSRSATYTLQVEVEENHVNKIYFGNGGWLDRDHMRPSELDEDGECKITSFEGQEYSIKIIGQTCGSYDLFEPLTERRVTLMDCASVLQMSEEELSDYENRFNASRTEVFSEEMCEKFRRYILSSRQLNAKRDAFEQQVNEGYIQGMYTRGADGDLYCNNLIVLKYGKFYWLEIDNRQKCTMGLMKFDESYAGWQEVPVQQDPAVNQINIYRMRVVEQGDSKEYLMSRINQYCPLD